MIVAVMLEDRLMTDDDDELRLQQAIEASLQEERLHHVGGTVS